MTTATEIPREVKREAGLSFRWLAVAAGRGARTLWLGFIPVLATAAVLRYLVPTPAEAEGTWAESLARIGDTHETACALVVLGMFVALTKYWSRWLPETGERSSAGSAASWVLVLGLGVGTALAARTVVGTYRVLSASMLPTLEPADVLAGNNLAYGLPFATAKRKAPQRGDIVVFAKPAGLEGPDHFVKRVVGLPGDKISMNGPHPVINGKEVPSCDAGGYFYPLATGGGAAGRAYVEFLDGHPHLILYAPSGEPWTQTYTVKPGEVFVLGDNRNNSVDSRYWNGGKGAGLSFAAVEGRAQWWLFGSRRDQYRDLSHPLRPLELQARLDGMDTAVIRDGIRNCLANPPAPEGGPAHGGS